MFDVTTPVEVWREYGDRKRMLYAAGIWSGDEFNRRMREIADTLGVGIDPDELSDEQRGEWDAAVERWSKPLSKPSTGPVSAYDFCKPYVDELLGRSK